MILASSGRTKGTPREPWPSHHPRRDRVAAAVRHHRTSTGSTVGAPFRPRRAGRVLGRPVSALPRTLLARPAEKALRQSQSPSWPCPSTRTRRTSASCPRSRCAAFFTLGTPELARSFGDVGAVPSLFLSIGPEDCGTFFRRAAGAACGGGVEGLGDREVGLRSAWPRMTASSRCCIQ